MAALLQQLKDGGAAIVVDLGFGDGGKGRLTDALVRRAGAMRVVRWNGGAQAGHTVIAPDGRAHTFSQLGAGSFVPGVRTLLAAPVCFDPLSLLVELDRLAWVGVPDALSRLDLAREARVVTPFHVALNRLRERARGGSRHGSCGAGVGECTRDGRENPALSLRAGDLLDRGRALHLARLTQERLLHEARDLPLDLEEATPLQDPALPARWVDRSHAVARSLRILDEDAIRRMLTRERRIVLEGAQGVLLDEHVGFHPYTTWSTCTPDAARALLDGFPGPVLTLGVLRAFAVRHGPGPLPTEDPALDTVPEPHNTTGPWQGRFRRGWMDLVLLRYALDACARSGAPVDGLALTHLDALPRLPGWKVAVEYPGLSLTPPARDDLEAAEAQTRALLAVAPRYEPLEKSDPQHFCDLVAEAAGVPVAWASTGPAAGDELPLGDGREGVLVDLNAVCTGPHPPCQAPSPACGRGFLPP